MKRCEYENASEGTVMVMKLREIHIEFNKDGTGRERASKRVLRAWEKVWRGLAGVCSPKGT